MLSLGADSEEDCLSILDALMADTLGCTVFLAHKDVDTDARLIRYLEDTADVRIAYPTHTHVSVARTLIAVLTFEITMLTHTHGLCVQYVCFSLLQMLIEASPLATGPAEEADGVLAVVCRSTRVGIMRRRAHLEDADRPMPLADDGDATLVARHLFKMRDANVFDVVRRL